MSQEVEIEKDYGQDPREGEVLEPKDQVIMDLKAALRNLKLGYNLSAKKCIQDALETLERKL